MENIARKVVLVYSTLAFVLPAVSLADYSPVPNCKILKESVKSPLFYVKVRTKVANLRKAPEIRRKTLVDRARRGDVFPVLEVYHNRYGTWYRVGDNLWIHKSVVEVVPWL